MFIDRDIEQTFTAAFGGLTTALVKGNIGYEAIIEAHFTGGQGIKACIGIEESTLKVEAKPFHGLKGSLKVGLEVIGVIMIAGHNTGGRHDKAVGIGDGQDVGGLGLLASLIGHRLAAFLGNGMAAIEIDLR